MNHSRRATGAAHAITLNSTLRSGTCAPSFGLIALETMRLTYAALVTLAALFACSQAVPTSADPKAVGKFEVALVDHTPGEGVNKVNSMRFIREENAKDDLKSDDEERVLGFVDNVKSVLSMVSQSATVGKAKDVAVAAATRAKAQANSIAVRSGTAIGNPLGEMTPLRNVLSYSPMSNRMMTMLTKFTGQATGVIRAGALTVKAPLEKLVSKYMASIVGLLNIAPPWNKLATNLTAKAIKTQLKKKITDVIWMLLIWVVKVQLQKHVSNYKATIDDFLNKLAPYRRMMATRSTVTSKSRLTVLSEMVTNVIVDILMWIIKVQLKKDSLQYKAILDKLSNNFVRNRNKKLVNPTVSNKTLLTDLAEKFTDMVLKLVVWFMKVQLKKVASKHKVSAYEHLDKLKMHWDKIAADATVVKIKAKLMEFIKKVADALLRVVVSIKKQLQKLALKYTVTIDT